MAAITNAAVLRKERTAALFASDKSE